MDIPLRSPRQIPCPDCRARANHACKRTKSGSVKIEFMRGFHAARQGAYTRIMQANPNATTNPNTWEENA